MFTDAEDYKDVGELRKKNTSIKLQSLKELILLYFIQAELPVE
jgi:hypothetical protein